MERLTAKNKHGKPIIKDWPNYMEFDIVNASPTSRTSWGMSTTWMNSRKWLRPNGRGGAWCCRVK